MTVFSTACSGLKLYGADSFPQSQTTTETFWYVAHTRPRCEKKLALYCKRENIDVTLPCVQSVKQYGRKVVTFEKPLFPGYVFFRSAHDHVRKVYQSKHVANVLTVFDQSTFERQIGDILRALESGYSVVGIIGLRAGAEVRIVAGPLAGMSGTVMKLLNHITVVLRLDFIGQCAAVVVDSANLEIVHHTA